MMRLVCLLVLLLVVPASALSFAEDFEDDVVGDNPSEEFYLFSETNDVGFVSDDDPVGGSKSLKVEGSGSVTFKLAGAAQLTDLDFTLKGTTISDDGVGSRQVVKIQSQSPTRSMVEFFLFCDDASNPGGCELRVKFDAADTFGEVLVAASAGDQEFEVEVEPDWTNGVFQLYVDAVDDGVFPFLELPSSVGKVQIEKPSGSKNVNLWFDDWFIDGASDAVASEGSDIAQGLKNWATAIHFTTPGSLFVLGLVFFAVLVLAVGIPGVVLSKDNTIAPALSFFVGLVSLWLVSLEWWPDWVALSMIILVSALISLVVRGLLMGLKDSNTSSGIVAGSLGYFIVATSLLGFSGYATDSIEIPTSSLETPDDVDEMTEKQSFTGAVIECAITFFSDCSQDSVSTTWAKITDIASAVFNFARTAFTFLFQLLTFSLPIPVVFNAMIVLPPAAALATVGFGFITRSGS